MFLRFKCNCCNLCGGFGMWLVRSHQAQFTYIFERMYHLCAANRMATLKHHVLACKVDNKGTCGGQGMWMCAKKNMLQIWKLIQNNDLHVVFEPKNDLKHSRNALEKPIGEGKMPTHFWEVINMWSKVVRGLILAQIRTIRADWVQNPFCAS